MPAWTITTRGERTRAQPGDLERHLQALRLLGHDEFTVTASSESPGIYVPELERLEVPDVIPLDEDAGA